MRRSYMFPALVLLCLLSACGVSSSPVATGPTTRPTAFMLPTASATGEPLPAAPSATVALALPTEAPPPAPEPTFTTAPGVTPQAPAPAEPQPLATAPPAPTPTEVPPTPTPELVPPTPAPTTAPGHMIMVDEPLPGAQVSSPYTVRGSTNFRPFEGTLDGVLKDGAGNVLVSFPVTVASPEVGQGGPFTAEVSFPSPASEQQGTLEIFETSPGDGAVVTFISILVRLTPPVEPAATPEQTEQPSTTLRQSPSADEVVSAADSQTEGVIEP